MTGTANEPVREKTRAEKRREAWQTFRRTLPDAIELAKPQAKLWALGLCVLMIGRVASLALPYAPKLVIDEVIPNKDFNLLLQIIGVVIVATIVQGSCAFLLTQTISKAGQRLIAALRLKVHTHVARLPLRYFDSHKTGEVTSRVMNDVEGVKYLVGTGMVEFLGGLLTAAMAFGILIYLNWQMTLAIGICLVVFGGIMIKVFSVMGPIFKERAKLTGDVTGRLTESIGGIRVVKAYNTESAERAVFAEGVQSLLANILKTINAISIVALISAVMLGIFGASIMLIGGKQMMDGTMSTGVFISYVLYLGFLIAPISGVVMVSTELSQVFAGLERMKEVLGEKPEDEGDEARKHLPSVAGEVVFDRVHFEYEAGKPVLTDLSFTAKPGTVTALVGHSGSGKSTTIGLVAAFHRPTGGRILIDGEDLSEVRLHDYRGFLGCVLQENFLFSGTLRENILYARPTATEEEVREAARLAYCDEFIVTLPKGFETIIGERGVKLSGGQRQRVAIARALLADPRLLILDEATSALDSESEAAIQAGLLQLMKGRTTFVIAHRLSTIRHADQILVLDHGRLIEQGTHAELIARRSRYYEMYSLQYAV